MSVNPVGTYNNNIILCSFDVRFNVKDILTNKFFDLV